MVAGFHTGQPFPGKNNLRDGLVASAGKESNWLQTVAGKNWFIVLRLYGPLDPWFDQTWKPGDIEELRSTAAAEG